MQEDDLLVIVYIQRMLSLVGNILEELKDAETKDTPSQISFPIDGINAIIFDGLKKLTVA